MKKYMFVFDFQNIQYSLLKNILLDILNTDVYKCTNINSTCVWKLLICSNFVISVRN